MPPHTTGPSGSKPPRSSTTRYIGTVVLLVLVVGGIAWIAQYLPAWRKQDEQKPPPPTTRLLLFPREVAGWSTTEAKGDKKNTDPDPSELFTYVEPGTKGHYDFLFQNPSEVDVDLAFCRTGCDCASVKVRHLSSSEWEALNKKQQATPGKDLELPKDSWYDLPREEKPAAGSPLVRIKAGGYGVLRVEWTAGAPGSDLKIGPVLHFHPTGDPHRRNTQQLFVPGKVAAPVQYDRPRLVVGPLAPGKSDTKPFYAWSSTRTHEELELSVYQNPPDPLMAFEIKKLSSEEAANLQKSLNAKEFATRVMSAYQVNVTVHETRGEKFLDQGTFYKKFTFALKGKPDPNAPMWGPEIVGRVYGDIRIGGSEDQGHIIFKPSFSARAGASKEIYLDADAKENLQTVDGHPDQPSYLKVKLTRGEKQPNSDRVSWLVEVTVPPKAARAGRFEDPNAVVLRIVGSGRLLRIPLEGHITE